MSELRALMSAGADPHILPSQLVELSSHEWPEVREAVAGNPSAPPEALAQLADDSDVQVQAAVAENRMAPPQVLMHMAECGWYEACETLLAVVRNPETPLSVVAAIAEALPANRGFWQYATAAEEEEFRAQLLEDPLAVPDDEGYPDNVARVAKVRLMGEIGPGG